MICSQGVSESRGLISNNWDFMGLELADMMRYNLLKLTGLSENLETTRFSTILPIKLAI